MLLKIKVKPHAKEEAIQQLLDGSYLVCVKEPAIEGRANAAVVRALAEYFKIPKLNVRLIKGLKSKNKVVEIK